MRRAPLVAAACVIAAGACGSGTDATTTTLAVAPTTTAPLTPTTTSAVDDVTTELFTVSKGGDGVTFQEDGEPPSGPTSFAVLADGSVVIADTHAVSRGEPRLLRFDRLGGPLPVIDLAEHQVASIVDVTSDGSRLALLDVHVATNRYRVLMLSTGGELEQEIPIPEGFRFEEGLTGLQWDDIGLLLEFEAGGSYARIDGGEITDVDVVPIFRGVEVVVGSRQDRSTEVQFGDTTFEVNRSTELGGVTLVGVSPDVTIVLVVDEVDSPDGAVRVTRRIQRYSAVGDLVSESTIDAGDQYVVVERPLELGADGGVLYMAAKPDGVQITPESELTSSGATA